VNAPGGFIWEHRASLFLDRLVDEDILYMDVQIALETLIRAGLHDQITVSFEFDDRTIHWHWMPPLSPVLAPLDVLTVIEQSGAIRVLIIRYSTRDRT